MFHRDQVATFFTPTYITINEQFYTKSGIEHMDAHPHVEDVMVYEAIPQPPLYFTTDDDQYPEDLGLEIVDHYIPGHESLWDIQKLEVHDLE